jgi:hypothetical protein
VLSLVSWRPLYPHTRQGFVSYGTEKETWWLRAIDWLKRERKSPAVEAALPGLEAHDRAPSIVALEQDLVHFALYKLRYPICPGELQLEADIKDTDLCTVCWRKHHPLESYAPHLCGWTLDTMELAMRKHWHGLKGKEKLERIEEYRIAVMTSEADKRQLNRLLQVNHTDPEMKENAPEYYLGEWFYRHAYKLGERGGYQQPRGGMGNPFMASNPLPNSMPHPAARQSPFLPATNLASTSSQEVGSASKTIPVAGPPPSSTLRPGPPAGTPTKPAAMKTKLTNTGKPYEYNPNFVVPARPPRWSPKLPTPQLDPVEKVLSCLTASHKKRGKTSLTASPDMRIEAPSGTPPPTPPAMHVTTRPDETLIDPSLIAVGGGDLLIKPEKPAPATPSKRVPDDPWALEKKNRVVPIRTTTGGKSLGLLEMYTGDDAKEADDRGGSDDPTPEDDADEAEIREASDDIRAMTVDREDMVLPVVAPAPLPPALDALAMSDGVSGAGAMQLVMNFIADSQKCEAELKKVKAQYKGDKTIWLEKEQGYRDLNKKMEAENKRLRRERNSARDDWKVCEADRVRFKNKLEHAVADKTDLEEQVRGLRVKLAALA